LIYLSCGVVRTNFGKGQSSMPVRSPWLLEILDFLCYTREALVLQDTRYMLCTAWTGLNLSCFFLSIFSPGAWRSAEVYRGELVREKIKSITSLFALIPVRVSLSLILVSSFCRFQVEQQDTTSLEWFTGLLFMVNESVLLHIIFFQTLLYLSQQHVGAQAEFQLQLNNLHKRCL